MGSFQARPKYDSVFATVADRPILFEGIHSHLSLVPTRTNSWRYLYVKRAVDVIVALMMLAIALIPGILIAAAIKVSSRGSVFYREARIGRDGRPFRIWKFRSMHPKVATQGRIEAVHPPSFTMRCRIHKDIPDPRVTAIGRFLRRWSLDELPQLLNVLCGDMSLIGPRPVVNAEVPLYGHLQQFYLAATPGLSGLWQVSGRSNVSFAVRADLDAYYVRHWNLRSDLRILLLTVPAVLSRVGAR